MSGIEKPNKDDINRFSGKLILTGSTTIEQNLRDTIETGTSGRLKPTVHANKSFNLLPSPTGVANSRENSQTRLRENIVSGEFDDFMRRTLRNPSSFPMEGIDETKQGVGLGNNQSLRINSPEIPLKSEDYNAQQSKRIAGQSPTGSAAVNTSVSRMNDAQNFMSQNSTTNRDSAVRGSSTFMSNAFNIVLKKPQ